MKIIHVVGARPNFMKIAPILQAVEKSNGELPPSSDRIVSQLVHTGQHYDFEMSRIFFKDLNLPEPNLYLEVGSGLHGEQTGKVLLEFEKVLLKEQPDLVIVVGDVNSTMACTLAAAKLGVPVAHVEAGLRSFDRTMPEEINRIVTDVLSEYLFTPSADGDANLRKEGIDKRKIHRVGNVMVDSLLANREKALESRILSMLRLTTEDGADRIDQEIRPYGLLTLHRPSNVDECDTFARILKALQIISERVPILFPIHPRTKKMLRTFGFEGCFIFGDLPLRIGENGIYCFSPMGYLEFMRLMMSARFVMTDSGGIQEETTVLDIPCLTLRNNTERPITIIQGTNILVGTNTGLIIEEALKILNGKGKKGTVPELWDGKAAERIVTIVRENF